MGFFEIFRKKGEQGPKERLTLAQLVERLKNEGYSEADIRDQLVKSFGKEQLKTFGEGATIPAEKGDAIVRDLKSENKRD